MLTNLAAEYVETGAGMKVLAGVVQEVQFEDPANIAEFVPEKDQFTSKKDAEK